MSDETTSPPSYAIVSGGDFVFTHLGICTMKIHRETGKAYVLFSPQLGRFHWVEISDAPMGPVDPKTRGRSGA